MRLMKFLRTMTLLSLVLFFTTINVAAQTVTGSTQDMEPDLSSDGLLQWNIVYYPKLQSDNNEIGNVKSNIAEILKEVEINDIKNNLIGIPENIVVLDDRIEVKIKRQNMAINYSDILLDCSLGVKEGIASDFPYSYSTRNQGYRFINVTVNGKKKEVRFKPYKVQFNNFVNFNFDEQGLNNAKKMADNLFFIQHQLNEKRYASQLVLFEPIAAQYRTLKVKPSLSEEQREYIVQANSFNQQKKFYKAIESYKIAIELNQTAYPAAYSNLALLSAQIQRFDAAIFYMKKYLMLLPDAEDARSAQDKIYEWKLKNEK